MRLGRLRDGRGDTNGDALYQSRGRPSSAREAFLAMHWFRYLSEGTDPAVIFVYLDYYRNVGWLDSASHDWLSRLAEGVATRREKASWKEFGMDVNRLAKSHLRNLRFLDKLLGTTLQHGEAEYLQQTVDMLLMEEDD
jgi:archaellum component FlaD/FlaE